MSWSAASSNATNNYNQALSWYNQNYPGDPTGAATFASNIAANGATYNSQMGQWMTPAPYLPATDQGNQLDSGSPGVQQLAVQPTNYNGDINAIIAAAQKNTPTNAMSVSPVAMPGNLPVNFGQGGLGGGVPVSGTPTTLGGVAPVQGVPAGGSISNNDPSLGNGTGLSSGSVNPAVRTAEQAIPTALGVAGVAGGLGAAAGLTGTGAGAAAGGGGGGGGGAALLPAATAGSPTLGDAAAGATAGAAAGAAGGAAAGGGLAGTLIPAAILGSGVAGALGVKVAGDAQAAAATSAATNAQQTNAAALAQQQQQFDATMKANAAALAQQQTNVQPYIDAGKTALGKLGSMAPDSFTAADFTANQDPAYQWDLSQGIKALQNSAAASGNLLSGNTLEAITNYGQQQASNEYQNAFNRYQTQYGTNLNVQQSIAGLGQTAVGQSNSASQNNASLNAQLGMSNSAANTAISQNSANAYGQGQIGAASANASGYVGVVNALNNATGAYINNNNSNTLINALTNKNSIYGS